MAKTYSTDHLRQQLEQSRAILVALPENPGLDTLAAGLALYFGLQKIQKQVVIFSPTPITAEYNRLIGVDQIKLSIANRNLVISWPHQSYRVERAYTEVDEQQDRFQIIIEPQVEGALIDHQQINYGYTGVSAGMIIFVGAKDPGDLAHLSADIEPVIESMQIVRVDTQNHGEHPRSMDYFDSQASSVSEVVFHLLSSLEVALDPDMATNILSGIEHQTQALSNLATSPDTFEAIAVCMRLGGKRGYIDTNQSYKHQSVPESYSSVSAPTPTQIKEEEPVMPSGEDMLSQPAELKKKVTPGWLVPRIFRTAKTA